MLAKELYVVVKAFVGFQKASLSLVSLQELPEINVTASICLYAK